MFPLKDSIPGRTFPAVTYFLILVNVALFLYEISLGPATSLLFVDWGLVPVKMVLPTDIVSLDEKVLPFITSQFLHGGWLHLIFNMYFLFIFGNNVEDMLGHSRYFVMYLIFGIAAGLTQTMLYPYAQIPTIGASGAVAGVMGAYFVFFPKARIKTLIFIIFFITVVDLPAVLFLGFWFFIQFISGVGSEEMAGGVAWWAHIGGFAAGLLYAMIFVAKNKKQSV